LWRCTVAPSALGGCYPSASHRGKQSTGAAKDSSTILLRRHPLLGGCAGCSRLLATVCRCPGDRVRSDRTSACVSRSRFVEGARVKLKARTWVGLAVVRDLRERRSPAGPEELAEFETDVLAGFVFARASAGLADGTIRSDVGHLEQVRSWFGHPLWGWDPPTLTPTSGGCCGQRRRAPGWRRR
jgi:hypothetical protein